MLCACFTALLTCLDAERFVRGVQLRQRFLFVFLFCFFLADEGREDSNTTMSVPSSARQRNAIKYRLWPNNKCWFGSFAIFQGIRTCIARKPYFFVICQKADPANTYMYTYIPANLSRDAVLSTYFCHY